MSEKPPNGVRLERTGWRCPAISERHRLWGFNCPAVDLDFLMLEYNNGIPVALVEYKERRAQRPDLSHATYRALRTLANNFAPGPLPLLVVFYDTQDWWFRVIPLNEQAKVFYGQFEGQAITEEQFVRGLFAMRKRALDASDELMLSKRSRTLPVEGESIQTTAKPTRLVDDGDPLNDPPEVKEYVRRQMELFADPS